jgi:predicted Rossmann fold flavoprotein
MLMRVRPIQALATATTRHIAVIGGGASGIFAAIAAARQGGSSPVSVTILEATSQTLAKVKISGGGRCNVLHDTTKTVPELLAGYPRGRRELQGLLHTGFSPRQAQAWFAREGVLLKTEADGRMFPTTDSSQTVMNALHDAARDAGVAYRLRCQVHALAPQSDGRWAVQLTQKETKANANDPTGASVGAPGTKEELFDAVILATGSAPVGYQLADQVGHTLVPTVPSLFTLNTRHELRDEDGRFFDLSGISVPWARVTLKVAVAGQKKKRSLTEEGPLLITHHGLSGPAALRLSAFGARDWHAIQYQGDVTVHWAPHLGTADEIFDELWSLTSLRPKKTVALVCPLLAADGDSSALPRRLWASLCTAAGVTTDHVWGAAPKKTVRKLALQISDCVVSVTSKGRFKEEFGTYMRVAGLGIGVYWGANRDLNNSLVYRSPY